MTLKASEAKYRTLIENLPQRIYLKDRDSVFLSCNANFSRDLKIKPEEIIGKTDYDFFPKELAEGYRKEDSGVVESGKVRELEEKYFRPADGQEIWIHDVKVPFRDKAGNVSGVLGIFWDITERKQIEDERRRMKAMGQVARSIGHDIRNPLQAIRTAVEILKDAPEKERQEMLELIDRDIDYSDRIIRNLMDFATLPPPKLSEGDVNTLLKETLAQIILPKNVKLTTRYTEILEVMLDRDQMTRAFTNLILNAIQAVPENSAGILNISTRPVSNFIEVRIKDTGVGISEKNLEKIFDPFYTTKSKGTGLGLPTAKTIVEAHRGTIKVESEEGAGTTVMVQLPVTPQK